MSTTQGNGQILANIMPQIKYTIYNVNLIYDYSF